MCVYVCLSVTHQSILELVCVISASLHLSPLTLSNQSTKERQKERERRGGGGGEPQFLAPIYLITISKKVLLEIRCLEKFWVRQKKKEKSRTSRRGRIFEFVKWLELCCSYSQTGSAKANGRETKVANTLAYDTATITTIKSFIVQAPGVNALKCFRINTNNMQNMQVIVSGRVFSG